MVNPDNKYRIARMRQIAGDVEPPSYVTSRVTATQPSHLVETQPSGYVETQPSHVEETPSFKPPPQVQPHARAGKAPAQTSTGYQFRRADPHPETDDVLDVVPDSEPLRAGPSGAPTPCRTRGPNRSPSKKPFHPLSPMSEHGSGELVPDSYEVEEQSEADDEDVPLAVKVNSKAPGKAPVVTPSEENSRALRKPKSVAPTTGVPKVSSPSFEKLRVTDG